MIRLLASASFCITLFFFCVAAHAAVTVSTSATCTSPPAPQIATNNASSGLTAASALSDIDCIFGGQNTGFATGAADGTITHLDLAVMGRAQADTGFVLVPGRESAAQSSMADMNVALNLLVSGGTVMGVLRITASQCEMLAGVFGEFRVTGSPAQSLTGCSPGTQVFAPYTRGVPFEISWFIHAEAFSVMNSQADDVGRLTFGSFEILTGGLGPNPGASLSFLEIPEPSSISLLGLGALAALIYRTRRKAGNLSDPRP